MIVRRPEAGQEYSEEDHEGRRIAMKPPQPRRPDRNERQIGDDILEVRNAEQSTLVGEMVIALILRNWRQQQ
jgi:hypothetical protein